MQNKRGRARTRLMSAIEFEALRPFLTHLSADRVEAARLALVEPVSQSLNDIAEKFDVTRQAIDRSVGAIWKIYEAYKESEAIRLGGIPKGWEQILIPSELAPQVQTLIDALPAKTKSRKKSEQ